MRPTVQPGGYPLAARWADRLLRPLRRTGALDLSASALQEAAGLSPADRRATAEPLALLARDLAETPPTALGAAVIRTAVVGGLLSRRRLGALSGGRPSRPVVLVGWYRTGTSYLHDLLSALPGYGHVPMHRMLEPVRRPGSRLRAELGSRLVHALAPEQKVVHPVRATGPEECWLWLASHLIVDGWAMHWTLPRFEAWLATVDRGPAYQTWATAAAHLQTELGHRLVLKDPAHLLALPQILSVAPDARFVWTHREPATCIASHASLTAIQHRSVYGRFDGRRAGRVCVDRFTAYTRAGEAARGCIPAAQLFDLPYERLRADPVEAVRALCAALELPFDAAAISQRAEVLSRPRPPHHYSLEQWGLRPAEVDAALREGSGP